MSGRGVGCWLLVVALAGCFGDDEPTVGESCGDGSSCAGGLFCAVGGDLAGQCTLECDSSEVCAARFGDDSVCYRGLCATDCLSSSDCASGLSCDFSEDVCVVSSSTNTPPRSSLPPTAGFAGSMVPPFAGSAGVPVAGFAGAPVAGVAGGPIAGFAGSMVPPSAEGRACTQASDCGGLFCCPQATEPGSLCRIDACVQGQVGSPCGSDAYCETGSCVDDTCAPLAEGEACDSNAQCETDRCIVGICAPPPAAEGEPCASGAYCESERCIDSLCAPPPLAEGEPCGGDAYCASDHCMAGTCGAPRVGTGTTCEIDDDCTSSHCCVDSATGMRSCDSACPTLIGDYCLVDADCPSGAFCQGSSNFADDGYCSWGCSNGCGYNSRGVANACIQRNAGSIPLSVCKPGCDTNGDCWEVHPDLSCWETSTEHACDFDTNTWASAF